MSDQVTAWIDALLDRHTRAFTPAEFLRAVRALSARYVEERQTLGDRSPLDSAGKRAAFAAFYAPLHFLTVRAAAQALHLEHAPVDAIMDLGCGTGVASAAWALAQPAPVSITGIDRLGWALDEAAWNWRTLGLNGRTRRGDMAAALASPQDSRRRRAAATTGIALGWSANELDRKARHGLLASLLDVSRRGTRVLVIEPLARSVVPWWDDWAAAFEGASGRADEWKFDVTLPPRLAAIDDAAGFRREALGARTLWIG